MAKTKTRRNEKEYDQLDKLKHENSKLKREITSLRKIVDRVDPIKYEELRQISKERRLERKLQENKERAKKNTKKDKWLCHVCGRGRMEIKKWPLNDGTTRYNRVCSFEKCKNRTNFKVYTKDVEDS